MTSEVSSEVIFFFSFIQPLRLGKRIFHFIGKCSYEIKNAPRGSHYGGKEDAAYAARRRRRVSQAKLFFKESSNRRIKKWNNISRNLSNLWWIAAC